MSAQLVQANAQAYLSFGKDKGKGQGKAKGKGKGRCLFRLSQLSLEDPRRRLKELKAKTECRACGRKGHRANDCACAMSSSSSSTPNQTRTARMTTRQQLTNQANQVGVCVVLNEYSDDPDTSAYMVGQNVLSPTEPTASAAVDTKDTATFNASVMDDNDETWSTEADHSTGWKKTFKSGTYRGMLHGIVLRGNPKQVVSLSKAESVPRSMREFLSWAQRQYPIDVTASTVERKTGGVASAGACPGGCKEFSHKGSNAHSIRLTCRICGTVRKEERHPHRQDQLHVLMDTRTTGRGTHTRERRIVSSVELTLILFRVRSLLRQHVQLLRIVMKSWQIGY